MIVLFEILLLFVIVVIGGTLPREEAAGLCRFGRSFRFLARRRRLAVLTVAITSLAINASIGLVRGIPSPCTTDEFSYLLAADTFAEGRITNPTHPFHEHFEATRIIHVPSYQSKFPPGQGLALALGQLPFGHPIYGVWISVALASAAVCWMLQAWFPPRWALLGGFLVAANTGIVSWWGQTYWGGAVALAGGALLFGALRRIVEHARLGDAILLGVGVAMLANSRPYEGLLVSLPAAGVMVIWTVRQLRNSQYSAIARVVVSIGVVLALAGAAMAYYNAEVTGDPLQMPYQLAHDYPVSAMIGSVPKLNNVPFYLQKLHIQWAFYIRILLLPPLALLPLVLRDRWMRFAALTCLLVLAGVTVEMAHGFPHYTAPITGLIFAILVQGMRHLKQCRWRGGAFGKVMVTMLPAAYAFSVAAFFLFGQSWYPTPDFCGLKVKSLQELDALPGKHLVVVQYGPDHHPSNEWVYNRADIDGAKVVWARSLGEKQDKQLLAYFSDRRHWLLFADERPIRVQNIARQPER